MNKRIKQLAQEAGMYVNANGAPWPKWMGAEECEVAYKKFAELIVQECIELNRQELSFNAFARMLDKYNEHFGVE
jgi:hypothetical protein